MNLNVCSKTLRCLHSAATCCKFAQASKTHDNKELSNQVQQLAAEVKNLQQENATLKKDNSDWIIALEQSESDNAAMRKIMDDISRIIKDE